MGKCVNWRLAAVAALVAGAWLTSGPLPTASAEEDLSKLDMVRIEEDWELYVDGPNAGRSVPQVRIEMAPSISSPFRAVFLLNHRESPDSALGGLEVQLWEGQTLRADKTYGTASLATAGEKVAWTQYLERKDNSLKFGLASGSSVTWGDLSLPQLHVNTGDTTLFFPLYTHTHSVQNSSIHYGANRLDTLKLVRVRYITDKDKVFVLDVASGTVYKKP